VAVLRLNSAKSCRTIGCDPRMKGRPLATRYIRDVDYIPLEAEDLDEGAGESISSPYRYYVSATSLNDVGPFGRKAQAAYLLDKVSLAIEADELDPVVWTDFTSLNVNLQEFLTIVMDQNLVRSRTYCGPVSLAFA
jgi:hypothetical protein